MTTDDVETIGQRIRNRRSALGLSQERLGSRAGIGRKAIGYLESGRHQPSARRLPQLAAALNVSVNWLLTGEESPAENVQSELAEIRNAIRELEKQLLDLYQLVERLSEQQLRWLSNAALSPGDPPWLDSPLS